MTSYDDYFKGLERIAHSETGKHLGPLKKNKDSLLAELAKQSQEGEELSAKLSNLRNEYKDLSAELANREEQLRRKEEDLKRKEEQRIAEAEAQRIAEAEARKAKEKAQKKNKVRIFSMIFNTMLGGILGLGYGFAVYLVYLEDKSISSGDMLGAFASIGFIVVWISCIFGATLGGVLKEVKKNGGILGIIGGAIAGIMAGAIGGIIAGIGGGIGGGIGLGIHELGVSYDSLVYIVFGVIFNAFIGFLGHLFNWNVFIKDDKDFF